MLSYLLVVITLAIFVLQAQADTSELLLLYI